MSVRVKFCGLTRAEDVAAAEAYGAEYVGVVFAGGPRQQSYDSASVILRDVVSARRVGVMGTVDVDQLAQAVAQVPLDVVQLHVAPSPDAIEQIRAACGCEVWTVVRVAGDIFPADSEALFRTADAVVLDTHVASGLGGSGKTFDWERVAERIAPYRGETQLVVAGGLTPDNVADAVRALRPDVVDVSSGVERSPGIKDHLLMRRFAEAARTAAMSQRDAI